MKAALGRFPRYRVPFFLAIATALSAAAFVILRPTLQGSNDVRKPWRLVVAGVPAESKRQWRDPEQTLDLVIVTKPKCGNPVSIMGLLENTRPLGGKLSALVLASAGEASASPPRLETGFSSTVPFVRRETPEGLAWSLDTRHDREAEELEFVFTANIARPDGYGHCHVDVPQIVGSTGLFRADPEAAVIDAGKQLGEIQVEPADVRRGQVDLLVPGWTPDVSSLGPHSIITPFQPPFYGPSTPHVGEGIRAICNVSAGGFGVPRANSALDSGCLASPRFSRADAESAIARDSLFGGLLAAAALTLWLEILFVLLEPAESTKQPG